MITASTVRAKALVAMASKMANDSLSIAPFMNEQFLRTILEQMQIMLQNINGFERYLFDEYDQFIEEVENFKACLLRFILKAKIHLNFLNNFFHRPKYQQNGETAKVNLIKDVMNEIDRGELVNYLISYDKLITTSIRLHAKYGTKLFEVKFILCKVFNFMTIEAVVGAAVGLVLPFIAPLEVISGALLDGVCGLAYGLFDVFFNWRSHLEQIKKVQKDLIDIKTILENLIQQIRSTHEKMDEGQVATAYQAKYTGFEDIKSLEEYVKVALNEFVGLENLLFPIRPIQ